MTQEPNFRAKLCERLGIPASADPRAILSALDSRLDAAAYGLPTGTVMIDETALKDLEARAAAGDIGGSSSRADRAVQNAIRTGRIPAARAQLWRDQIARNPAAEQTLNLLAPGLPPIGASQADDPATDDDALYAKVWGGPKLVEMAPDDQELYAKVWGGRS